MSFYMLVVGSRGQAAGTEAGSSGLSSSLVRCSADEIGEPAAHGRRNFTTARPKIALDEIERIGI